MSRSPLLLDFHEWAGLRLDGPDALEFLQGVSTQDVATLEIGTARPALFLTDKGRPVALAWASLDVNRSSALLFIAPGGSDALPRHLERMRVMEDVTWGNPPGAPRLFGVSGKGKAETARAWAALVPGAEVVEGDPATFLLVPERVGDARFVPGTEPASPEAAEAWRVAVGIPRAGVDFDSERIATELALEDAISLTKGCYVGQEVVARTTHRGAVRRRRVGFRYSTASSPAVPLPPGTALRSREAVAGMITSSTLEPGTGRGLGMGYLTTEALDDPGEVIAIHDDTTTHLEVAPWPL